jgi:hypothetical protein
MDRSMRGHVVWVERQANILLARRCHALAMAAMARQGEAIESSQV